MTAVLLTLPEAARTVGRSRDFIARAVAEGTLTAVKVGSRRYIPESALLALSSVLTAVDAEHAPVTLARFPRALPRA